LKALLMMEPDDRRGCIFDATLLHEAAIPARSAVLQALEAAHRYRDQTTLLNRAEEDEREQTCERPFESRTVLAGTAYAGRSRSAPNHGDASDANAARRGKLTAFKNDVFTLCVEVQLVGRWGRWATGLFQIAI